MLKTCKKCCGEGGIRVMGKYLPCPVCKGTKKVEAPDGMNICDNCDGSGGKHTVRGKDPCLVCGGSGFVPAEKKDA